MSGAVSGVLEVMIKYTVNNIQYDEVVDIGQNAHLMQHKRKPISKCYIE